MKIKELIPLSKEELRELINSKMININEDIDLERDLDEYSMDIKLSLLEQLNKRYGKKVRKEIKEKNKKE